MPHLNLKLVREFEEPTGLVGGKLFMPNSDGALSVYTLENKEYLLPSGHYFIGFNWSPKFSHACPYRQYFHGKVPYLCNNDISVNRGFRIHCGNTLADTRGCILLGHTLRFNDRLECVGVNMSSTAYRIFMDYVSLHGLDVQYNLDIIDNYTIPF